MDYSDGISSFLGLGNSEEKSAEHCLIQFYFLILLRKYMYQLCTVTYFPFIQHCEEIVVSEKSFIMLALLNASDETQPWLEIIFRLTKLVCDVPHPPPSIGFISLYLAK